MQLQVLTNKGEICLKMESHGLLYARFLRYFENTPYFPLLVSLEKDFQITHTDLTFVLDRIVADIKEMKDELRVAPKLDALRDQLVKVKVLGETLLLAARVPLQAQLLQLHYLYLDFRKASENRRDLFVFLVPALTSIQSRILNVLKNTAEGLDTAHLPDALSREYRRLTHLEIVTEELKQQFTQEMASFNRESFINEIIDFFLKWGLLEKDPKGRRITATKKLKLIQL